MQITSFQKTLLGIGAGLGVIGGGVGLIVARNHRKDEEAAQYRATPLPVDEFVDRTIDAFDQRTFGDPISPRPMTDEDAEKLDGVLNLGIEDVVRDTDHQYFPELLEVTKGPSEGYYNRIVGRDFLRAADADSNGSVNRAELVAAVTPYAGGDGKLDEAERRKVLVDGKLGVVVDTDKHPIPVISGWERGGVVTASSAADMLLDNYMPYDSKLEDEGSPAVKIAELEPKIPWTDWQEKTDLGTGPITSAQPQLAKIDDEFGNGNGLLSQAEAATWIAKEFADPKLLPGHVTDARDAWKNALEPTRLGRVDASKLSGSLYVNDEVPKATVDRFFSGSIPAYVDSQPGFKAARGDAPWQPDGEDAPATRTEGASE